MSRDPARKGYYSRDRERDVRVRERDRNWERHSYRGYEKSRPVGRKRSRSRSRDEKRRSRSPRKNDKDILDENILSEISKLPEPSELWDNQFQDTGFSGAPPPPSFQQEGVPNANYPTGYQASYSGAYDDFPPVSSLPQPPHPPDITSWNQMSLPPPPAPVPFLNNVEDQMKKEAAIESEMRHQKAALSKQREDYIKKAGILKKELDTLKDQRNELRGDPKRSPSPDTKRFLKENTKLQLEIQNKLKTINNVVDMLNGIIGEEAQEVIDSDDSADRSSKRKSRSPSNKKFNYVYYDPEMHWCRVCNDFPPTAKDYLNHLHSPAHHKMAAAHMEAPWHTVMGMNEGFPNFPSAPNKRTPIKGLQFFVPSTAWYCKLCDQFIGDLHCASAHLKSIVHSKNYTNFVEQNPHWETDWMSDRQKAFEKARASKGKTEEKPQYTSHTITFNKDGFHTKRKESPTTPTAEDKKKKKDKKKKNKRKRSSSSSSSSSNSSSSDSEPVKKKKSKNKKEKKIDPDDKTLTEWMSSIQMDKLNEKDRKLLDNLKTRIKLDNFEDDKRRSKDRDRSERDRERERDRDRERDRSEQARKLRESEKRESRESRASRSRENSRRRSPALTDAKKPEIKKMPFIGKMPVYKTLSKGTKNDDQKKDEQKKKDDDEASKKRREEMDAEIQKKVAEFKEKIAKAQLEREAQENLPPPGIALPTALGANMFLPPQAHIPVPTVTTAPSITVPQPAPTPQPPTNLPKDFQEALEIIFPSEVKNQEMGQQDGLFAMPPFPLGPLNPFQPLGLMQPQMPQMFGFDLNAPRFPMPQLYDTHVPIVPNKPRPNKNGRQNHKNDQKHQNKKNQKPDNQENKEKVTTNPTTTKNKEELDDLAMLGIDASDVGAGI